MSDSVTGHNVHATSLQVLCEGGHGDDTTKTIDTIIRDNVPLSQHASKINQNAFWNLIPVTNMGGQPLETGYYSIMNVANGPISHGPESAEAQLGSVAPVVSSSSPASVSHVS